MSEPTLAEHIARPLWALFCPWRWKWCEPGGTIDIRESWIKQIENEKRTTGFATVPPAHARGYPGPHHPPIAANLRYRPTLPPSPPRDTDA